MTPTMARLAAGGGIATGAAAARLAYEEAYEEAIEGIEPPPHEAPAEEEPPPPEEPPLPRAMFVKPRRQRTLTEDEVVKARSETEVKMALHGVKEFSLKEGGTENAGGRGEVAQRRGEAG